MSSLEAIEAKRIIHEFVEDVRTAFGVPMFKGDAEKSLLIDEKAMDWPDLVATYKKAVHFLSANGGPTS